VRAVLDPNILVAALLSRDGPPAQIVARWLAGEYELVVSPLLIAELERVLANPKLRARVTADEAAEFVAVLREGALVAPDPPDAVVRSADPADDYLPALAESRHAVLVSGDRHLLDLAGELPVQTVREFLTSLG
jgi:putative PIN family toxin of toxin-antitoxin system